MMNIYRLALSSCAVVIGIAFNVRTLAAEPQAPAARQKRVAAIVTEYRHNSHADVIVSRLLQTDTLDGKGRESPLELVSLYTDQRPANDISRLLAASHRFRVSESIADALTLGTGQLGVDGILLVAEHGQYPKSKTGNTQYPKKRLWDETVQVFRASGRVVPVFIDKHLADNWEDAKAIYDTARALQVPLMAGSSLPGSLRKPAADVARDAKLREIVSITYGSSDAYAFHAMEFTQALAEQRAGGETGIKAVRTLSGPAVWQAFEDKIFDPQLFAAAWQHIPNPRTDAKGLRDVVPEPKLFTLEYNDGLKAHLLELNGAVSAFAGAWRYAEDGRIESCEFWTQEGRPAAHFTLLLNGIEQMMLTGQPTWNVERTLLVSGALDALLASLTDGSRRIETPYLDVRYQPRWRWQPPPPPPPMRPWAEQ